MFNHFISLINFITIDFSRSIRPTEYMWWLSQAFALIAMVFFLWGWSVKNKTKVMVLIGIASAAMAGSAPFLGNYSLAVLFGLAAMRNFVFAYLDWRAIKEKHVAKWLPYLLAGIFAALTITATALLAHTGMALWLEWAICITLLGLIAGNVVKGSNVMRISFIFNRSLNIINHLYFGNLISVVIASLSICSIALYYIRILIARHKMQKALMLAGMQKRGDAPAAACDCGTDIADAALSIPQEYDTPNTLELMHGDWAKEEFLTVDGITLEKMVEAQAIVQEVAQKEDLVTEGV